ncbi:ras-related protein Rab-24 isoform X2 [Denticeps clupeoides]|uniref:ras-related protein Rab-24 isoform X2 n=1 Tax=Denticeps clupeoides TaxID=299321 RepID=UPI0010A2D163|nr:ras-related protein Rab-24 isoform X2 [Denticeps clupeoides]
MTAMRVDAKVVMLGKESVGKTSLVERYVHRRFLVGPYQNTIGAAFVAKQIHVGDKVVTLGIWVLYVSLFLILLDRAFVIIATPHSTRPQDTAGSERYEAMSRIYYRGARAAIVCYDLTDSSSFQRAKFWVKELQNCEEHCKIYLCGTKSDLAEADRSIRQVDYHDVQDFADEIGAQHFETSSKTGNNVDELFQKVAEDFSSSAFELMPEGTGVDLGQKKDSYIYSCCHN